MNKISGEKKKTYWYNPRQGTSRLIGEFKSEKEKVYYPLSAGRGEDCILVLDDADKDFEEPGIIG